MKNHHSKETENEDQECSLDDER